MDGLNFKPALPDMRVNIRNPMIEYVESVSAQTACKQLEKVFIQFMSKLQPDEEVGLALTSFGVVRQIVVVSVRAIGQSLLEISGIENGNEVILIQHVSQLNFLLIPMKTASAEQPARRKIGFSAE